MIWTKELAMTSFHNGLNARTNSNHRWTLVRSENRLSLTRDPWPWHTKIGCGWHPQDTCKCQGAKLRVYRSSVLWKTLLTPGHEFKALDAMNSLRLWMTWNTLGCELRALDAMNNLRLCMIWMTRESELKILHVMNNSRLWMIWTILGHERMALNAMNSSRL